MGVLETTVLIAFAICFLLAFFDLIRLFLSSLFTYILAVALSGFLWGWMSNGPAVYHVITVPSSVYLAFLFRSVEERLTVTAIVRGVSNKYPRPL